VLIPLANLGFHPGLDRRQNRMRDRSRDRSKIDDLWSVLAAGRKQLPIAAMAAGMGGNIRDWKTTYGWDRGSWPPATQLKCIAPVRLSMVWDRKSQHQPMHVRS
jgi:hypothetical protein